MAADSHAEVEIDPDPSDTSADNSGANDTQLPKDPVSIARLLSSGQILPAFLIKNQDDEAAEAAEDDEDDEDADEKSANVSGDQTIQASATEKARVNRMQAAEDYKAESNSVASETETDSASADDTLSVPGNSRLEQTVLIRETDLSKVTKFAVNGGKWNNWGEINGFVEAFDYEYFTDNSTDSSDISNRKMIRKIIHGPGTLTEKRKEVHRNFDQLFVGYTGVRDFFWKSLEEMLSNPKWWTLVMMDGNLEVVCKLTPFSRNADAVRIIFETFVNTVKPLRAPKRGKKYSPEDERRTLDGIVDTFMQKRELYIKRSQKRIEQRVALRLQIVTKNTCFNFTDQAVPVFTQSPSYLEAVIACLSSDKLAGYWPLRLFLMREKYAALTGAIKSVCQPTLTFDTRVIEAAEKGDFIHRRTPRLRVKCDNRPDLKLISEMFVPNMGRASPFMYIFERELFTAATVLSPLHTNIGGFPDENDTECVPGMNTRHWENTTLAAGFLFGSVANQDFLPVALNNLLALQSNTDDLLLIDSARANAVSKNTDRAIKTHKRFVDMVVKAINTVANSTKRASVASILNWCKEYIDSNLSAFDQGYAPGYHAVGITGLKLSKIQNAETPDSILASGIFTKAADEVKTRMHSVLEKYELEQTDDIERHCKDAESSMANLVKATFKVFEVKDSSYLSRLMRLVDALGFDALVAQCTTIVHASAGLADLWNDHLVRNVRIAETNDVFRFKDVHFPYLRIIGVILALVVMETRLEYAVKSVDIRNERAISANFKAKISSQMWANHVSEATLLVDKFYKKFGELDVPYNSEAGKLEVPVAFSDFMHKTYSRVNVIAFRVLDEAREMYKPIEDIFRASAKTMSSAKQKKPDVTTRLAPRVMPRMSASSSVPAKPSGGDGGGKMLPLASPVPTERTFAAETGMRWPTGKPMDYSTPYASEKHQTEKSETAAPYPPDLLNNMQIYVRTLTGKMFALSVNESDSIESVKVKILDKEGIDTDLQRLIYAGKELKNSLTLRGCGVVGGAELHLVYGTPDDQPYPRQDFRSGQGKETIEKLAERLDAIRANTAKIRDEYNVKFEKLVNIFKTGELKELTFDLVGLIERIGESAEETLRQVKEERANEYKTFISTGKRTDYAINVFKLQTEIAVATSENEAVNVLLQLIDTKLGNLSELKTLNSPEVQRFPSRANPIDDSGSAVSLSTQMMSDIVNKPEHSTFEAYYKDQFTDAEKTDLSKVGTWFKDSAFCVFLNKGLYEFIKTNLNSYTQNLLSTHEGRLVPCNVFTDEILSVDTLEKAKEMFSRLCIEMSEDRNIFYSWSVYCGVNLLEETAKSKLKEDDLKEFTEFSRRETRRLLLTDGNSFAVNYILARSITEMFPSSGGPYADFDFPKEGYRTTFSANLGNIDSTMRIRDVTPHVNAVFMACLLGAIDHFGLVKGSKMGALLNHWKKVYNPSVNVEFYGNQEVEREQTENLRIGALWKDDSTATPLAAEFAPFRKPAAAAVAEESGKPHRSALAAAYAEPEAGSEKRGHDIRRTNFAPPAGNSHMLDESAENQADATLGGIISRIHHYETSIAAAEEQIERRNTPAGLHVEQRTREATRELYSREMESLRQRNDEAWHRLDTQRERFFRDSRNLDANAKNLAREIVKINNLKVSKLQKSLDDGEIGETEYGNLAETYHSRNALLEQCNDIASDAEADQDQLGGLLGYLSDGDDDNDETHRQNPQYDPSIEDRVRIFEKLVWLENEINRKRGIVANLEAAYVKRHGSRGGMHNDPEIVHARSEIHDMSSEFVQLNNPNQYWTKFIWELVDYAQMTTEEAVKAGKEAEDDEHAAEQGEEY